MTLVRPDRAAGTARVGAVADAERYRLDALIDADPLVNAVVAARLAGSRSLTSGDLPGQLLGSWTLDRLTAAALHAGNLIVVGGGPPDWTGLGGHLAGLPRACTSIVGRARAVEAVWAELEPSWGAARAVRASQPLLALRRGEPVGAEADHRVRPLRLADVERYLPAAAAMFTEELGISPLLGADAQSYRRRIVSHLRAGRAFGLVDADGRIAFKADIGVLTPATCQVHGVWVRPDLRGRGLATAGLAAVLGHALRLAPTASLYVNDFNLPARRVYARLGMTQVATLSTVLF